MSPPVRSLLQRLLRRVIVPLALTWLVGTLLAFAVARFFTQQAFDRALLDDAYAVASHVRLTENGGLTLGLTANEMGTLLFDQSERLYFAGCSNDDRFLAGHAGLQMPQLDDLKNFTFTEMEFNNKTLRAVVLMRQVPQAFKVVVAQTTNSQVAFFQRLLVVSMVPQLLLLLGLAWWLRRKIQQDVQPLTDLQNAVALRDVRDLKPVFVSNRTAEMQDLSEAINALLLPLTTVVTPNTNELRALAPNGDSFDASANELLDRGCQHVLLTGTHANSPKVINRLYTRHQPTRSYTWQRLEHEYHGSGCTLAAALAGYLAHGLQINEAAQQAQRFTWESLNHGIRAGFGQLLPNRSHWNH